LTPVSERVCSTGSEKATPGLVKWGTRSEERSAEIEREFREQKANIGLEIQEIER
jgi:hypothetical protein